MKVYEAMTKNPESIHADDTIKKAAKMMKDLNVGALPVVDGQDASGILTDRDIAIRVIADEKDLNSPVKEVMTSKVESCPEDADAGDALKMMEQRKIRRLLVKNQNDKVTGILSLGDLAVALGREAAGEALRKISEPAQPQR
jgi:CBS domain-containing protein